MLRRRRWWLRGVNTSLPFLTDGFIFLGLRDPQDREGAVKKRNLKMYAFFFHAFVVVVVFSSSSQALGQGFSLLERQSQRAVAPPQKAKKKCGFNRWSLPRTDVRPRGCFIQPHSPHDLQTQLAARFAARGKVCSNETLVSYSFHFFSSTYKSQPQCELPVPPPISREFRSVRKKRKGSRFKK